MAGNTTMILSARGALYQVSLADATTSSKSIYSVEGLTINNAVASPKSPILIDGVRTRESDIVSRVPCLNNYKVYYSFGQNFGDISITGVVLLGPMGDVQTDGVKRLLDYFARLRVSIYQKAIKVNILDKAYSMFLEGIQIMEVDKEYHILPFSLFGTRVDLSRTAPPKTNPNTVVLADVNLDDSSLAAALSVTQPSIPGTASDTGTSDTGTTAASSAAANNDASTSSKNNTGNADDAHGSLTALTATPTSKNPVSTMGKITSPDAANTFYQIKSPTFPQAPFSDLTSAGTAPSSVLPASALSTVNVWNMAPVR